MSSPLPFVINTLLFYLLSCESATASALPWPTEEHRHSTRSAWAGHASRSTDSPTKTGMPAWKIAVLSLGLFFGVMALGVIGGALEVLLHTRKKVADPDSAGLDFGPRAGADLSAGDGGEKAIREGGDVDEDGAAAVDGEGSAQGSDGDEADEKHGSRFSWQDAQGVQMEVWNEEDASREMSHDASQYLEHGAHPEDGTSAEYLQQPQSAYFGEEYHHEDVGSNGYDHDEVQDLHGQRMTQYEPCVPQTEDDFQVIPLPGHGSQSKTTHQQHHAEYI